MTMLMPPLMSPMTLLLPLPTRSNIVLNLDIMIRRPISQFLKIATGMGLQEIGVEHVGRGGVLDGEGGEVAVALDVLADVVDAMF
jgi:hypothetical protein